VNRTLLFLSRIHPKKGVDVLLRAWRNVQDSNRDWNLVICGPDCNGHLNQMRGLAQSIHAQRVTFTGMIAEDQKSDYYRSAELYVLPTHNDNWAVTVADALAHAVPAIVSRGAPWSGLEQHRCGWWIDNTVDTLTDCLRTALALSPSDLAERGRRGRDWMARDFSWSLAGEMMQSTYRWLVQGGTAPRWVLT
jgi:glycosyltransferase involved in cell wall biosynthesis